MTQNSGRRPDGAAFVIAAVLAGFGLLLVWEASRIPDKAGYSGVGPGDIPALVGWGLLLLAGWTALAAWRGEFEPRPGKRSAPLAWVSRRAGPATRAASSGGVLDCVGVAFRLHGGGVRQAQPLADHSGGHCIRAGGLWHLRWPAEAELARRSD